MKKLMIAAAAAAMISGAGAMEAQVYDFTATIKTTNCKAAKVTKALESYFARTGFDNSVWTKLGFDFEKGDQIGLRKQASRKILGVIWGCDCPTIAVPGWRVNPGVKFNTVGGYIFWDQANDDYFRIRRTAFRWNVLNRIDAMTKCEGSFSLLNCIADQGLALYGAGFGTVKEEGCATYISSISGNVAGFRRPNDADISGCAFCQQAEDCTVAPICDWCFDLAVWNPNVTVATGTWSIKFNKSMSKNLSKVGYLSQVYKFKKAGNAALMLDLIENIVDDGIINADDEEEGVDPDMIDICDADDEKCQEALDDYAGHEKLIKITTVMDAIKAQTTDKALLKLLNDTEFVEDAEDEVFGDLATTIDEILECDECEEDFS